MDGGTGRAGDCSSFTFHSKCTLAPVLAPSISLQWASGQVVRAFDCCAKHRWFEPNPRIIVGMLAHCSPSSKWVPGGNTGEVKGGEERNWLPYHTLPTARDKCPSNGHSPNVRNRTWDSPLPLYPYNFDLHTHTPSRKMLFRQP